MNRIRSLTAASAVALTLSFVTFPSYSQVVVFDPNNYAQNVLTAARAVQQINNQITSLQNQAQMLFLIGAGVGAFIAFLFMVSGGRALTASDVKGLSTSGR